MEITYQLSTGIRLYGIKIKMDIYIDRNPSNMLCNGNTLILKKVVIWTPHNFKIHHTRWGITIVQHSSLQIRP
jgi:hypothetical protein